jgi:hypothetical protein
MGPLQSGESLNAGPHLHYFYPRCPSLELQNVNCFVNLICSVGIDMQVDYSHVKTSHIDYAALCMMHCHQR